MSCKARQLLEQALAVSHELVAAADQPDLQTVARLDAQRLLLLQSLRLGRDELSAGDLSVLGQISELNDRAIGLVEHHRRNTGRALDLAAVGRRAVAAYSSSRLQR